MTNPSISVSVQWCLTTFYPPSCVFVLQHAPVYTLNETYIDQSEGSAVQTCYTYPCSSPSASFLLCSSVDSPFSLIPNSPGGASEQGSAGQINAPLNRSFFFLFFIQEKEKTETTCVCVCVCKAHSILQWP